ncbi:MAG: serine/threonine protein kinase [Rhodanobacteraceae bacterium]|nr:serine/threonine protein kinase [Rhodanobacteraceae bacterium]
MESIDLLLVERFGTLSPLGSGGMGEVFRGIDPGLGRPVAIKRMRQPSLAMRERLRREAKILERLQHPNVCPLLEWHEVDDSAWMVMPVIEGESLSIVAKQLAIAEIAPLFEQICRGIEAAHALGLIHRDIKPSNILVDRVGGHWHPWIMDFGIARSQEEQTLTGSHEVMGTPGYMAPEQARGDSHEVDQRSDVFGIGATLFYALTLEPPFGRGTLAEVLARVLEQDAPSPRDLRPETPDALGRIVLRCLERDPARRYPDVAALRNDLECFRTGERVHAPSNGPWFYAQRAWRRHPRFWAGVFALGWVAALALGYAVNSELSSAARAVQMSQTAALAERVRATMHSALLAPMHDIGADRERLGVQISTLLAMPEPNDPELRRQHLRALRDAYADIEDGDSALVFARRLAQSAGAEDLDRLRYIEVAIDRFRDAVRPFQSLPKDLRDDYSTDARKRILEPALALGRSLSLPAPIAARLAAIDGDLDTAQKLAESLPRVRSDDTSVLQLRAEIAGAQSRWRLIRAQWIRRSR